MFPIVVSALVRRVLLLGLTGLSLFAVLACEPPWPKCNDDKNCRSDKEGNQNKRNFFCVQGQCQECRDANDCADPKRQKCDGYKCIDKTCADITCEQNKRCDPSTLACKWICENDGDTPCDGDACQVCKSHACTPKPPPCTQDGDCPASQICKQTGSGSCERSCVGGCSASKPCPAGKKCDGDRCVDDACDMETIYFNFNRAAIRSDAADALKKNLDCVNKMTGKKILIEGHADERGTREYNIKLGERRAAAAKSYFSKLGVAGDRLCQVVSKGREEPAVSNASTEEQHQKNRRGVFKFLDSCP